MRYVIDTYTIRPRKRSIWPFILVVIGICIVGAMHDEQVHREQIDQQVIKDFTPTTAPVVGER
jgi:hypothetical protein